MNNLILTSIGLLSLTIGAAFFTIAALGTWLMVLAVNHVKVWLVAILYSTIAGSAWVLIYTLWPFSIVVKGT